jgi:hypothetical protein
MDAQAAFSPLKVSRQHLKKLKPKQLNIRRTIKKQWPFTKTATNSNTSTPSKPTPKVTDQQSEKWYQHITDLQLRNFIDCVVNDNYHALVITGNPSAQDLLLAWSEIQAEYADVMGDYEHKLFVALFKEVTLLKISLQTIHCLIEILREVHYEPFTAELNKLLRTSFVFDPADQNKYQETLRRCYNRSKGIKIDLELKLVQFKAIEKKNMEAGSKPTKEYFQSILITLSDHATYPVQDTITVYEFADRIRRFHNYCEQVKQQANGR